MVFLKTHMNENYPPPRCISGFMSPRDKIPKAIPMYSKMRFLGAPCQSLLAIPSPRILRWRPNTKFKFQSHKPDFRGFLPLQCDISIVSQYVNKKRLKNVGPIRHSMSTTTTTTTTRDRGPRGDRYGPIEWAQKGAWHCP